MPAITSDLSLTEWVVLAIVAEGETHGFSVARELRADAPAGRIWTVPRPLVYRAIDALAARGLLERSGSAPGAGGPARALVRATDDGGAAVTAWLVAPVTHVRDARSTLIMKLYFTDRRGHDPGPLVARQRARLAEIAQGLAAQEATGFDATLVRWRHAQVVALDAFLADLADPDR